MDAAGLNPVKTGAERRFRGVAMSKAYSNLTLFLAYDHHQFYDLELKKPDPKIAYTINLEIEPQNGDTLMLTGTNSPRQRRWVQFQSPMMKIYSRFVVTYNHKLPHAAN